MSPVQVNSSQQLAQSNLNGQAEEPILDGSFCGRVCAAVKRVGKNIVYCSAYVAFEAVISAYIHYSQCEDDTCSKSSRAYLGAGLGAFYAVSFCFLSSFIIECAEPLPEKTAVSTNTKQVGS